MLACELADVDRCGGHVTLFEIGDIARRIFVNSTPCAAQPVIRGSFGMDPSVRGFLPVAFSLAGQFETFDPIFAVIGEIYI